MVNFFLKNCPFEGRRKIGKVAEQQLHQQQVTVISSISYCPLFTFTCEELWKVNLANNLIPAHCVNLGTFQMVIWAGHCWSFYVDYLTYSDTIILLNDETSLRLKLHSDITQQVHGRARVQI